MTGGRPGCAAPRHGDESAYRQGCRCATAIEDKRLKDKRRRHNTHTAAYVPNVGTARRLQALAVLGWSINDLAARLGSSPATLTQIRQGRRDQVRRDIAERVEDVFEQLSATPGDAKLVSARATAWGWAPPLAWDDIDDPAARPATTDEPARRGRVDVDEVKFLESCRVSRDDIAARLGVAVESIDRAVHRAAQRARTENMIARAREAADAATPSWASAPTLQRALNEAFGDDHAMAH